MNPAADTYPLRANPAATTTATAAIHPAGPIRPVRRRSHSQAIASPARIIRIAKLVALQTSARMVIGASTSTDANRSFRLSATPSPRGSAIAAFAAMELTDGLLKVGPREVGPQGIDEDQFGIGKLP